MLEMEYDYGFSPRDTQDVLNPSESVKIAYRDLAKRLILFGSGGCACMALILIACTSYIVLAEAPILSLLTGLLNVVLYCSILAGLLLFVVAVIGYVAHLQFDKKYIWMFLVGLLFVAVFLLGIYITLLRTQNDESLEREEQLKYIIIQYGINKDKDSMLNAFQQLYGCCGYDAPIDWKFNGGFSHCRQRDPLECFFPYSCYSKKGENSKRVHTEGCRPIIKNILNNIYFASEIMAVLFVLTMVIIFTIVATTVMLLNFVESVSRQVQSSNIPLMENRGISIHQPSPPRYDELSFTTTGCSLPDTTGEGDFDISFRGPSFTLSATDGETYPSTTMEVALPSTTKEEVFPLTSNEVFSTSTEAQPSISSEESHLSTFNEDRGSYEFTTIFGKVKNAALEIKLQDESASNVDEETTV